MITQKNIKKSREMEAINKEIIIKELSTIKIYRDVFNLPRQTVIFWKNQERNGKESNVRKMPYIKLLAVYYHISIEKLIEILNESRVNEEIAA